MSPGWTGCTRSRAPHRQHAWAGGRCAPLQEQAVGPVLDGADALLLAPTAGGKTEAAVFPLLTAMEHAALVRAVGPLRLPAQGAAEQPAAPAGDLRRLARPPGRDLARRRHRLGAAADPARAARRAADHAGVAGSDADQPQGRAPAAVRRRAGVVVDEVHAFAGDDRGWHLLAVLERLTRVAGRPIQRIGLSATVGNPDELLRWLQGSAGRAAFRNRGRAGAGTVRTVPAAGTAAAMPRTAARPRRGHRAGLCGVGEQRRHGDRLAAPGREAAGVLRLPAAGRGDRRRAAGAGRHDVPVARVAAARRAAPGRAGVRRGAGLRDRGDLHAGAGHRRRRPGPGHPGQRPADAWRRSCSASGGPGGGPGPAATACSWRWTRARCCGPPGCCTCGARDSSSRWCRRRSRGTSWPSSCSRCACRSTGSAAGCGWRRGTAWRRSTAAPSRSCGTWSSRGSSTRTASCCSSARPPSSGSGTGTSWA